LVRIEVCFALLIIPTQPTELATLAIDQHASVFGRRCFVKIAAALVAIRVMNFKAIYLLQLLFAAVVIVLWFLRRPGKCTGCGARLAVKNGFCQECGKAADGHHFSSQNQTTNPKRPSKLARYQAICYVLAIVILIPSIGLLPFDSGIKFLLGLSVVVGGLVWLSLALKRDAACRSCGQVTFGAYCSHCGNGKNGIHR
jgi:hypothetical protein